MRPLVSSLNFKIKSIPFRTFCATLRWSTALRGKHHVQFFQPAGPWKRSDLLADRHRSSDHRFCGSGGRHHDRTEASGREKAGASPLLRPAGRTGSRGSPHHRPQAGACVRTGRQKRESGPVPVPDRADQRQGEKADHRGGHSLRRIRFLHRDGRHQQPVDPP